MKQTVFITGTSSGLGHEFAKCYLMKGWQVFGISRRPSEDLVAIPNFYFQPLDLRKFDEIPSAMGKLFDQVEEIDLIILNAGALGTIGDLTEAKLAELRQLMDTNVWANKVLLDFLLKDRFNPKQVITISSGASINGHRGWSGYSLSKATLNMLTQLYAQEFPKVHFTALAPGLIDTSMQDYLCERADENRFPSVKILKEARNTPKMPKPDVAAENILSLLPKLLTYKSGAYVDIRKM